jgi:hypothetical protein
MKKIPSLPLLRNTTRYEAFWKKKNDLRSTVSKKKTDGENFGFFFG